MASNSYYNKITFGSSTLIDLTSDTVSANNLLSGVTAHAANGATITGNIAFLPAMTYTPGSSTQIISSGVYLSGNQTINGDANLIAENIADGVSIFGISGTHSGGGGMEDAIITKIITSCDDSTITEIRRGAFFYCESLENIRFTSCSYIGAQAFERCASLHTAIFNCATAGFIGARAFYSCYSLLSFYLLASSVWTMDYELMGGTFASTPIGGYTDYTDGVYGSIYVPASLVSAYKSATNWAVYSSRITAYQG